MMEKKSSRLASILVDLLTNLLFVPLLVAYVAFGGWLFFVFEGDKIAAQSYTERLAASNAKYQADFQATVNQFAPELYKFMTDTAKEETDELRKKDMVKEALEGFGHKINKIEPEPVLKDGEQPPEWDMWNSTMFAATLVTTIGYGHISLKTREGQLTAILYSLVGIPMVLIMLASWGKLMFRIMRFVYNSICICFAKFKCFRCGSCKKVSEDSKEEESAPILLALLILVFWITVFASIYYYTNHQGLTYFQSFYFFFISFTTIGLGDYHPKSPQDFAIAFTMILIGMSIISLCINAIQSNLEAMFAEMMSDVERSYREDVVASAAGEKAGAVKSFKQGCRKRLMYLMMSRSKREMLQKRVDKYARLRSAQTQTDPLPSPMTSRAPSEAKASPRVSPPAASVAQSQPNLTPKFKESYINGSPIPETPNIYSPNSLRTMSTLESDV